MAKVTFWQGIERVKPPVFNYHRPETLAEALELLANLDDAKILAGGQSLMPMMNFRYVMPEDVVDINRIGELAEINSTSDGLVFGAMVRHNQAKESPLVAERCPLIAYGMEFVAHVQIRNRGTIGGSLSHLDPSAEWPALLAAYDAVLQVQSKSGGRDVPILEWSQGFMTPNLQEGEMLTGISVPSWPAGHTYGFAELARRKGDFALAGAAALLHFDGDRIARAAIALTGVDTGPVRLAEAEESLVGNVPSDNLFQDAASQASSVAGIDDVHASAAYRQKIAVVMARRALEEALARKNGEALAA
ncbi:MAG: molybdopterin dehydrogenase [Rhodospirillaceae bacterium]|nr:molybdopterin dehydrogenase [Rhodospirillaceae bacterium]HAA92453.1 xanthine dehydrogenase family protein subunit M [Rhodospirillaceae bacterium]